MVTSTISLDQREARAAIEEVASRAGALIRSADPNARVPGSEWTAGQTAAHLVVVFRLYAEALEGKPGRLTEHYTGGDGEARARLAAGNVSALSDVAERDPAKQAEALADAVGAFLAATADRSAHTPLCIPWFPKGEARPLGLMAGVALGELVVHGYDIAKASRRPWPIDPAHARMVIAGTAAVVPFFVNVDTAKGVQACYQVHVRGGSRFVVRFDGEAAQVEPPGRRVDCHLSVDPVAFLLVAYGRVSQWGPIANGKLVAWGRKPWLGFKFKSLLLSP